MSEDLSRFGMRFAHKIALDLNNEQIDYMTRACGVARFAYNWALASWKQWYREYKEGKRDKTPKEGDLRKELNRIKRTEFPWMLEVTKSAPQQAIRNLGKAFQNFFEHRAKYPKFKKKGQHDSFYLSNDQFTIQGKKIKIPKLGFVKMREELRFKDAKILSATISRKADHWFVSIAVEIDQPTIQRTENQGAVGVDLGVSNLATLSTGEKKEGKKPLKKLLKQLKMAGKNLSRKNKRSKNYQKTQTKLGRLHLKIANIRKDYLHKLTTELANNFSLIGIEDLNVKGMFTNPHLARALADTGFGEFRRQLQYKSDKFAFELFIVDRWFPSSKTCSNCGYKLEQLDLSIREWQCPQCGCIHDRDVNAAINLRNLAVSSTVTACGEHSSGRSRTDSGETILIEARI